jgi:hypothetical protein
MPTAKVELQLYSFFNLGARWGGWLTPRPGRFTPGQEIRYPFYRRLGGPQSWCKRVRKISPSLGLDPRTVHPTSSHYTDWANRPTYFYSNKHNFSIVNQLMCSPSCMLTHIFVKVCELEYITGCTKVSLLYSCFHTKWCTLHTNLKIHNFVACVIACLRARTVVCMCIKFFLKVSGLIIYL